MSTSYICPMHPEIVKNKPGRCPKCGMKLVKDKELGQSNHHQTTNEGIKSYTPLIVVITLITIISLAISFNEFAIRKFIEFFMIGFFITFSGFKLMDLSGFAQGYSTYDLLAKKWFGYGFLYPFIELFFALAMIINLFPKQILLAEIIVMAFSGIGVAIKLLKKERFQCACLGTFLKVPLTKITLIEDFGMAFLAFYLLLTA